MTKLRPGGQEVSLNIVRFARLCHGRCVTTRPRVNLRKDERLLLNSSLLRTGAGMSVRWISNSSRRGA